MFDRADNKSVHELFIKEIEDWFSVVHNELGHSEDSSCDQHHIEKYLSGVTSNYLKYSNLFIYLFLNLEMLA